MVIMAVGIAKAREDATMPMSKIAIAKEVEWRVRRNIQKQETVDKSSHVTMKAPSHSPCFKPQTLTI